jgi:hypothetical protein
MHKGKPYDQLMPFGLSITPPLLLGMREGQLDLTIEDLGKATEMLVLAESSTLVIRPERAARCIMSDAGSTTANFCLAAKELKRQRHQIRLTFECSGRASSCIIEVEQVRLVERVPFQIL